MSTEFEDRISIQALTLQDSAAEECEEEADLGRFLEADEDEREERLICCMQCSCVIGEEVSYADDFGWGPICDNCLSGQIDEFASYRG
jgi:hypothetical protein